MHLYWLMLFSFFFLQNTFAQEHCISQRVLNEKLTLHADSRNSYLQAQKNISHRLGSQALNRNEVFTIPVVVHVVWKEAQENISDDIIFSQIESLNKDFQQRNTNQNVIPNEFAGLAADIGFEFCLANIDPLGAQTNGIVRTETDYSCIGNFGEVTENGVPRVYYTNLGGSDAWDSDRYLNIWVASTCRQFVGYGSFPGEFIKEEDGIIVHSDFFGIRDQASTSAPYFLGKTATHEIGHYFNLRHIWGESGSCDMDDGISDTPFQETSYLNSCPIHPISSCGSNDMFMNFMDYSDDECLAMFTLEQKNTMLATLMAERASLLESDVCVKEEIVFDTPIFLYPNPAKDCLNILLDETIQGTIDLRILNTAGQEVYINTINASGLHAPDLSHLANGIYFVNFNHNDEVYFSKFVIAK